MLPPLEKPNYAERVAKTIVAAATESESA